MKNFYPTWQEASAAAINCKLLSIKEYQKNASNCDPRLPSTPNFYYEDFPGWRVFLDIGDKYYRTWEEASAVAVSLGISSSKDYINNAQGFNVKLPSNPRICYSDFPGWKIFLEVKCKYYATWQEASAAAIALGINSYTSYDYKLDSRLPSSPSAYYKDFPGWKEFLSIKKEEKYPTWQEASDAVMDLGIRHRDDYTRNHDKDKKLPRNPYTQYKNFPGWAEFLGL